MARTRAGFIRILTISTVAAFAGLPFVASAQQPDQGAIQEIIVTAQKREANLQDVPFSVSATSQDQIRNSGATDLVDLARNIAGFAVADLGPGQSQVAIRGISSGQVIRDQPGVKEQVGVYLDESPISVALFTPDLELYDLDRFEVLRGPQGTLFGAGSESGTVRYITHQPQLGKTEVSLDASLETVSHGDEGGYLRAALNLPVTDVVAARLVGYWHHLPGFVDAITPIGPIGANSPSGFNVQKSINDGDRSGVRLAFLVKPSADLSITPRIMFQKLETNGYPRTDLYNILGNSYTATQPPVSIGSLQQYRQQHDGMIDDFTLADLKVDYDTGPGTLTSITSFTHRNVLVARDATQLTGSVTFDVFGNVFTPNNPAGVRTNSPLFDRTHLNVLSQEVRLASNGKQMIDWLVGGFFQHVGRRYGQNLPTPGYDALNASFGFWPGCPTPPGPPCSFPLGNDTLGPADTPFFSDLSYRLKQYAAFGEGTWHATDQIAVTAGLRYYKFNEDRVLNFHGGFAAGTPAGGVPGSTDSNGVSPRLILSYKPVGDGPTRHVQHFGVLCRYQGPAGHDDCGHVLVTHRVQRAHGPQHGRRSGTVRAAERQLGLRHLGDGHRRQADFVRYFDDTAADGLSSGDPVYCRRSGWLGGRQPPTDRAEDTGGGKRRLYRAGEERNGRLRERNRAVRGLLILAVRERADRLGSDRRQRRPECGAADHVRRTVDRERHQLQSGAAELHAGQLPTWPEDQSLAAGGVHHQHQRQECAAGARLRARPQRTRRLPDQPAAHHRSVRKLRLLRAPGGAGCPRGRGNTGRLAQGSLSCRGAAPARCASRCRKRRSLEREMA